MHLLLGTRAFRSGPEEAEDYSSEDHGEVPVACCLLVNLAAEFWWVLNEFSCNYVGFGPLWQYVGQVLNPHLSYKLLVTVRVFLQSENMSHVSIEF